MSAPAMHSIVACALSVGLLPTVEQRKRALGVEDGDDYTVFEEEMLAEFVASLGLIDEIRAIARDGAAT